MSLSLSPSERQLAYHMLGVTAQELVDIEKAPFKQGEERLKKLKARVRKTFKHLALKYHPDQNCGDTQKAQTLDLLIRATKELCARQAKVEAPWVEPKPPVTPAPKWSVHTTTVSAPGTKPFMQANIRRPRARPDPREQAARLGKMRP